MKNLFLLLILLTLTATLTSTQVLEITPETQQLAYDLTDLLGVHEQVLQSAEVTIDVWIVNDPSLLPYRDAMVAWTRWGLTRGEYASPIARVLLDTYSDQELRELTTFFSTPTGKKTLVQLPHLLDLSRELGSLLMEQHKEDVGRFILSTPQDAHHSAGEEEHFLSGNSGA